MERIALTEQELKKIAEKDFAADRLIFVRDIFLFSCYTGLSYADVEKLRYSEIVKGIDDENWIFTNRQKTGTSTTLQILTQSLLGVSQP